eukprot:2430250-Amphidinium_carterae.1
MLEKSELEVSERNEQACAVDCTDTILIREDGICSKVATLLITLSPSNSSKPQHRGKSKRISSNAEVVGHGITPRDSQSGYDLTTPNSWHFEADGRKGIIHCEKGFLIAPWVLTTQTTEAKMQACLCTAFLGTEALQMSLQTALWSSSDCSSSSTHRHRQRQLHNLHGTQEKMAALATAEWKQRPLHP